MYEVLPIEMRPFLVPKLEWLTETRFDPEEGFGMCLVIWKSVSWLSFPSVGPPKHIVLEVGLFKGHVHFGESRLERSSVCPSLPELLVQ